MPRILSLMFHRIHDPLNKERVSQFEQFLKTLVKNYDIVLPSQIVTNGSSAITSVMTSSNHCSAKRSVAICLTFDDAYYDFYHYVYPLLKSLNIKALLAIPVNAIMADSHAQPATRLAITTLHRSSAHASPIATPLCTWKELNEMADSGHVIMASHGYQHADLTLKETDIQQEVAYSKTILEQRLKQSIDYFVYPYGRMSSHIHRYVRQHYAYGIRIGNAYNVGSPLSSGLIYRLDADPFWIKNKKIDHPVLNLQLLLKYYGNRLRLK